MSRYAPVVLATSQLPITSTPSLSLKRMPTPAGPLAPASTLPLTRRRELYITNTPTTLSTMRLSRTTESWAYMKCEP
jgi:hypothetical protein